MTKSARSQFKFSIEVVVEDTDDDWVKRVEVVIPTGNNSGWSDFTCYVRDMDHDKAARSAIIAASVACRLLDQGMHSPELNDASQAIKKHCSWINEYQHKLLD